MRLPHSILRVVAASAGILAIGGCSTHDEQKPITRSHIERAETIIGLSFTGDERDSLLDNVNTSLQSYGSMREVGLNNSIMPALLFNPIPAGFRFEQTQRPVRLSPVRPAMPASVEDLAFAPVRELGELIRSRKVTSEQLTKMFLDRLKKYGPKLECVVTLTEELALEQARRADREISAGQYRGPLHGIPYGAKDLLSTRRYKTTWGAMPFKDQIIDEDAMVIKKLEAAGAVLVAKLTLGALAWGDVWFGGMTRNPWNPEQGSSGSSAGSAAATAAGLVPFAIGTETWGSIVSPSTRCGTTGLRPSYGRVSRTGAMALSWSMDKIGPITRSAEDCAIVFNAIIGPDGVDPTLYDVPFNYDYSVSLKALRIGYLKTEFDSARSNKTNNDAVLEVLRSLGANLIPIELPDYPTSALSIILSAEAAAAFDDLTRSGKD
ncbi:MAG: amidase, partial [Bacteroidota bacterium]